MARVMDQDWMPSPERRRAPLAAAFLIGLGIFVADLLSPLQGAVAVLYIIVVLLVARACGPREVLAAGFVCAGLALTAFAADHLGDPIDAAYVRLGVSLVAIVATTLLSVGQLRAEAEQRRSEQRYRTIFDGAGFPIWESDWSGTRQYLLDTVPADVDRRAWLAAHPHAVRAAVGRAVIGQANQAAADLFGGTRAGMVGQSQVGEHAPGTEPALVDILVSLAEGAEMAENDVRYITLDGRTVDVVLRVRLIAEGDPWSRALLIALDVTERNEARARAEQTMAELAHAARVSTLGQLAASIAHEVNQPLAAIVNYGKSGKRWLAHDVPNIGEAEGCLDHIVANGNRAAEVVARVRSQARKTAPEPGPLDLQELVEEAAGLIAREAGAADVSVQIADGAPVPHVIGDRVQVQQVLVNLLVNAIQAMRESAAPRRLQVRLDSEADVVRLAVIDSGVGIAGDPARIFDPFFTTKGDGMGLGLSICRSIVEAQGGRIAAVNNADRGATIAFTLPVDTSV
jgi:PAS domain S-box-containing protein